MRVGWALSRNAAVVRGSGVFWGLDATVSDVPGAGRLILGVSDIRLFGEK